MNRADIIAMCALGALIFAALLAVAVSWARRVTAKIDAIASRMGIRPGGGYRTIDEVEAELEERLVEIRAIRNHRK